MSFTWSDSFTLGEPTTALKGDKIILPQSALESIIQQHANAPLPPPPEIDPNYDPTSWEPSPYDNYRPPAPRELPSPLTFQIRNPSNRLLTHGGVKEFSAEDGLVHLPAWMMTSLSVKVGDQVAVKYADLPKGTWAKFRPISSDYMEILDFRALLESVLRSHYTTLTRGEVLKVSQGTKEFSFVVEELKPSPEAVCITDTDLEVDIEPLDTDMDQHQDSATPGSKAAGKRPARDSALKIGYESQGRVPVEGYQTWTVDVPNRQSGVRVQVTVQEPGDLDLLVSVKAPATLEDHIWADFTSDEVRSIVIPASDKDYSTQEGSQTIHLAVYGRASAVNAASGSGSGSGEAFYNIVVEYHDAIATDSTTSTSVSGLSASTTEVPNKNAPGYQECANCGSWIPERTMMLHSNFCFRNNAKCDRCGDVMKKEELANHWHCDHCDKHGHISEKTKHTEIFHGWYQCSCGSFESTSLPELALHRRTTCSERFIICQYCHILVQQGPPASNPRDRIRGLSSHESYCGDRTIQCQKCSQKVSLKDVQVHAQNHEFQRQNQSTPHICSNQNCVRPRGTNVLGLCQLCFGPYWVPTEDPKNQKLIQRLARKYHAQLMQGCGNNWCRNEFCATFKREQMDATAAASELMKMLKEAKIGSNPSSIGGDGGKLWLCVDEGTTRKKVMAELLFEDMKGKYAMAWCVKALETERTDLDAAVQWLNLQAPRIKK
ncbi:hypothetical protein BGZ83_010999 [Gryganskiella cystojenkinii]|nr:hypothetical protein BGZ83_010999 [Gryganskiella cystojenkinii]